MARYSLGDKSREKLSSCHPLLQQLAQELIRVTPIDFTVLEGLRTLERQQHLFSLGPKVTTRDGILKKSKHQADDAGRSRAIDIAPWPIDWQDLTRFYYLAGAAKACAQFHEIPIRWGGDWDGDGSWRDQSFHDLPHFELTGDLSK